MSYVAKDPKGIAYTVVRSKRKTVSLEVRRDGTVIVRVPYFLKNEDVSHLVEEKRAWILRKQKEMFNKQTPEQNLYCEGSKLSYLGDCYTLRMIEEKRTTAHIERTKEHIIATIPEGESSRIKEILLTWYYDQAAKVIQDEVLYYAKKLDVQYQRIAIKNQKTRWGSCSSKGNLNFNFRLILAPKQVLSYVVVHELCHLIHLNHSKDFWDTVRLVMPEYEQYNNWLKQYGGQLNI